VKEFLNQNRSDPFVQRRVRRNLSETKPAVSKDNFWHRIVACLLTSQQRSGPGSAVSRFIGAEPFPLAYESCLVQDDLESYTRDVLTSFGGLRFSNRIANHVVVNLAALEGGLWTEAQQVLDSLRMTQTRESERSAAIFIDRHFKGFGPKQSRNLLQSLGLTRYEIPIDSRITRWLNGFGFPVTLSAGALSDHNYYDFVSDGFQQLCAESDVYPCVLDAAIFSSFDRGGWSEQTTLW
jgi:hypothetical protein